MARCHDAYLFARPVSGFAAGLVFFLRFILNSSLHFKSRLYLRYSMFAVERLGKPVGHVGMEVKTFLREEIFPVLRMSGLPPVNFKIAGIESGDHLPAEAAPFRSPHKYIFG